MHPLESQKKVCELYREVCCSNLWLNTSSCTDINKARKKLQRNPQCWDFLLPKLLLYSMSKKLLSKVAMSGTKHLSHSLLFLLLVTGVGSKQMGSINPLTWTTLPEASKSCYELISCGCKKGCVKRCKCKKAALQCTGVKENIEGTYHGEHSNMFINSATVIFTESNLYESKLPCGT